MLRTAMFLIYLLNIISASIVDVEIHRRMATTFLAAPRTSFTDERLSSRRITQVTGFEIRRYTPVLCGDDNIHFVDDQCKPCGEEDVPCASTRQPDLVWFETVEDDLTAYEVCAGGLVWKYNYEAGRPFCERPDVTLPFLITVRPWEFNQPFVYIISRIDCRYCKQAAALLRQFSGVYPDLLVFDVQSELGANGVDVRTELSPSRYEVLTFKRPAYACNQPITAAAPGAATGEFLNILIQPLIHIWNETSAESWLYDWRRLDRLPESVLGNPVVGNPTATLDIQECHDLGQRNRDAAMHTFYVASTGSVASTSTSGLRAASTACCSNEDGCALDKSHLELELEVCELDDDCELKGASSLDVVECEAIARAESANAFVETPLTHKSLQWNQDMDWMSRRDIRTCYVRTDDDGRRFSFSIYDGINFNRVCKRCPTTSTRSATLSGELNVATSMREIRVNNFTKVRRRATEQCRESLHDETCSVAYECGNSTGGVACLRGTPDRNDYCLKDERCDVNIDQYECEYIYRSHFRNATVDQTIDMLVRGRPEVNLTGSDIRGCVLHSSGALFTSEDVSSFQQVKHVCAPSTSQPCEVPFRSHPQLPSPPLSPPPTAPSPSPPSPSPPPPSPSPPLAFASAPRHPSSSTTAVFFAVATAVSRTPPPSPPPPPPPPSPPPPPPPTPPPSPPPSPHPSSPPSPSLPPPNEPPPSPSLPPPDPPLPIPDEGQFLPSPPPPRGGGVTLNQCPDHPNEPYYDPCLDPSLSGSPMCYNARKWAVCGKCNVYEQVSTGAPPSSFGCQQDSDCSVSCDNSATCDGCGCSTIFGYNYGACIANNPYDNPPTSSGCVAGICLSPVPAKQCVCFATQAEYNTFNLYRNNFQPTSSSSQSNILFWNSAP